MRVIVIRAALTAGFASPQPFEFEEILDTAKSKGFSLPPDKGITVAVDDMGLQMQIDRLVRGKTEVSYNRTKGHLAISSTKLTDLTSGMDQLFTVLEQALGEVPPIIWHELNYYAKVRAEQLPLGKELDAGPPKALKDRVDLPLRLYSRAWCGFEGEVPNIPLNEVTDWLHLSIAPFVKNPRFFYANLVYRRQDFSLLKRIIPDVDEIIKDAIKS